MKPEEMVEIPKEIVRVSSENNLALLTLLDRYLHKFDVPEFVKAIKQDEKILQLINKACKDLIDTKDIFSYTENKNNEFRISLLKHEKGLDTEQSDRIKSAIENMERYMEGL